MLQEAGAQCQREHGEELTRGNNWSLPPQEFPSGPEEEGSRERNQLPR
jgi:hypothetical protein